MSKLISACQVVPASTIARKLDAVRLTLRRLEEDARAACLQDAVAIGALADLVSGVAFKLEQKARDHYVAARKGEVP